MIASRMLGRVALAAACAGASGCDDGPRNPIAPTPAAAIVTFQVADERFSVRLTDQERIATAWALFWSGSARIPNGRIVAGQGVNAPWSWHLEDVEFAEVTMELCDGRPSDVQQAGPSYGGGRYCPWSARIVRIVMEE